MHKRKIVKIDEVKCNGCGLCIPNCSQGAIQIIDNKARLISDLFCDGLGACLNYCPKGAITIEEREAHPVGLHLEALKNQSSIFASPQLKNWPVQISLVPPQAPYLNNADFLIAADCVPFAYPAFHQDLLRGKVLLVGCPKLDDLNFYQDKITQILKNNKVKSVTYAHMEVPCCFGLIKVIQSAISDSGKKISFEEVTISIKGEKIQGGCNVL
jgi:ferredoxin